MKKLEEKIKRRLDSQQYQAATQDYRSALRMVREALEELGPVGVLVSEEHGCCTPTASSSPVMREGEELVAGIQRMAEAAKR